MSKPPTEPLKERIQRFVEVLPGTRTIEINRAELLCQVNRKNFACWFETDVAGDPELALRLPPERVRKLRESRLWTFCAPTPRTWSHWLGIVMKPHGVDWTELSQLLLDAYIHTAPQVPALPAGKGAACATNTSP